MNEPISDPSVGDGPHRAPGRLERRRQRNREALLQAAAAVMSERGLDGATMAEIAERADVGAGTIYNYFKSKDELAIAVLEELMHNLALRIEETTRNFTDPAQIYAFGIRTVLETATTDPSWRQLLSRSEVIADALFRRMGPFAIRDLRNAADAGRFKIPNPELVWRLSTHAIVGVSLAMTTGTVSTDSTDQVIVRLLCMTGIGAEAAMELAMRPRPPLASSDKQPTAKRATRGGRSVKDTRA